MKRCPKCGQVKAADQFHRNKTMKDGLDSWCRNCKSMLFKQYYAANRERIKQRHKDNYEASGGRSDAAKAVAREWGRRRRQQMTPDQRWSRALRERHGMTPWQWQRMWDEQDGRCYLCGELLSEDRSGVVIDHDHRHCGEKRSCAKCWRGIACNNCNGGIGLLGDNPARIRIIAANLERAQASVQAQIMNAPLAEALF